MKNVYFTILERFTRYELEEQKKTLEMLLHKCLLLSEKERIDSKKVKQSQGVSTEGADENCTEGSTELITHSKRRRQTLRKQIKKIDDRIAVLDAEGDAVIKQNDTVNPKVKDGWGFWRK